MPRPALRRMTMALPLAVLTPCLLLAGCGGGSDSQTAGNTVEMRDMDVVDGTVNDSMTDLDAVKADGVGAVSNSTTSTASRPRAQTNASEEDAPDAETVPAE